MPSKRRRKAKAAVNPYLTYALRIASWEPSYMFALNDTRFHQGPYWEHAELKLSGECLAPAKLAGRTAKLTLLGDRRDKQMLEEPPQSDWKPLGVGSVTSRGDQTEFLGSIPIDALWGLISALASGTVQFVDMYGERLRYGSARLRSISFCRELDPEDLEFAREQH
jgi:hypothetical protein